MRNMSILDRALFVVFRIIGREGVRFDPSIPNSYLAKYVTEKFVDFLRGLLITKNPRLLFFKGAGTKVKCAKNIRFGKSVRFASNVYVDALAREPVVLGSHFSLGRGASIECTGSLLQIGKGFISGDFVGIGSFCFFGAAGGITIGDNTIFGNFVSLHSENHNFHERDRPIRLQGVTRQGIRIGRNCWIGAKVTILDGVIVEDNVIIAAGSILPAGTYEGNSIYGGVPARKLKTLLQE